MERIARKDLIHAMKDDALLVRCKCKDEAKNLLSFIQKECDGILFYDGTKLNAETDADTWFLYKHNTVYGIKEGAVVFTRERYISSSEYFKDSIIISHENIVSFDLAKDTTVGDEVLIISGGIGAFGANQKLGRVTSSEHTSGLTKYDVGVNVKLLNGEIWKIRKDAEVIILRNGLFGDSLALKSFLLKRNVDTEDINKTILAVINSNDKIKEAEVIVDVSQV